MQAPKMKRQTTARALTQSEFLALAEFRYQLRKYLRHMEQQARASGHNPQQYQLLLAIKGLPPDRTPNIAAVAERMQLSHNSMVGLVDRCEKRGLLRRIRSGSDRRQVRLELTGKGEAVMRQQASVSREELRDIGPLLVDSLQRLLADRGALLPQKPRLNI